MPNKQHGYRKYVFSFTCNHKMPNSFDRSRSWAKNLHGKSKSTIPKPSSQSNQQTPSSSSTAGNKRTSSVSIKKLVKRQKTYNQTSTVSDAPLDAYSIIQNELLLSLLSKTKCECCYKQWNGKLQMNKREGLFVILSFECSNCNNEIRLSTDMFYIRQESRIFISIFFLDSSPQIPGSKRHDINVRAQLAGHLTGIRHAGLKKISAALNLPPPLEEGRHNKRDKELLQEVQVFTRKSMSAAIQEAVTAAKATDLTVSGDGTWQTRGYFSKHGAATLVSTCDPPKVVDIETCSKTCNVCIGNSFWLF
jgi:hypothetical protein